MRKEIMKNQSAIKKNGFCFVIVFLGVLCIIISVIAMVFVFGKDEINANELISSNTNHVAQASKTRMNNDEDDNNKNIGELNLGEYKLSEGQQVNSEVGNISNLYYIENANYFLANPQHRDNVKSDYKYGTCTTIAHQILLGYHNYYSDRRLIPEFGNNGKRFLSEDYGDLNQHPNVNSSTLYDNGLGRPSLGTSDDMFNELFDLTKEGDILSQKIGNVASAADKFLSNYLGSRTKNWEIKKQNYSKQTVLSELDEGRPVILGFKLLQTGSFHVVVAYGHAVIDGTFGFIAHYGWEKPYVQMWMPENWIGDIVTMSVDHEHELEDMEETYGSKYRALRCKTCGCEILDEKYVASLFGGGDGSLEKPFCVGTAEQFRNIEKTHRPVYVPREGTREQINYAFRLTQNIQLSSTDWVPFDYPFTGTLDGDGHYITYNMTLSQADINASTDWGLFRTISYGGTVKDLTLRSCNITCTGELTRSDGYIVGVGTLVGGVVEGGEINNVEILSCKIDCNIITACVGGIAGSISRTPVNNCDITGGEFITYHGLLGGMAGTGDISYFHGGNVVTTLTKNNYQDTDKIGEVVGNTTAKSNVSTKVTINRNKCIAAGTLITLADGSQVPVEELTGDEMLLVWNLFTGEFDTAPILFIDSDPEMTYEIINLTFSDGTTVKTIYEHGFWDYDLGEYVYLDKDAAQYIGHWFNKLTTDEDGEFASVRVQLTNVAITQELTTAYSPVTYGHFCYYVNGMLSMPGGIKGLFNIFEVDEDTMTYDAQAMAEDIAQYGLFTYEEFAQFCPLSEEMFLACGGQYLKVALGKGLITEERLVALVERYGSFFD